MKNYYCATLILFALNVFSQAPRGFYGKASINQTVINSKDILSTSGIGYNACLNYNTGYHETYNYQIEVSYNHSAFGLKNTENTYTEVKTTDFEFNTLNAGFYFNYYIIKPEEDKFFLGPQIGGEFLFSGPIQPANGAATNDQYFLPYLVESEQIKRTPAINYNAGLGLTGGYNNFRFDLRYSLGLSNVLSDTKINSYDDNGRYTGPTLEGKINTFSFGISYNLFPLKK
jgi:hypothetical protein